MELSDITNQFIGNIKVTDLLKDSLQKELDNVVALISPHAGYYFSGKVAASGFNQINTYDNVFIIATSHKITFNGIAILDDTEYDGLSLNTDLITELEQNDLFFKNIDLFKDDHNLEIQLPFLKEKLPTTPIIPLMVGETNVDNLIKISETLKPYFNGKNLFVISSDFSHYPSYDDAIKIDFQSVESILSLNLDKLKNYITDDIKINKLVTKMCGWSSIIILINILSQIKEIDSKVLMYKNSGHVTGDKSGVVGYFSIAFTKEKEFELSYSDKTELINISRNTLDTYIKDNMIPDANYDEISDNLKTNLGSFVTLKKDGNLRGCIGIFGPNYSLCDVVKNMTISSSSHDNRFPKVVENELNSIEIEISVLTPFKKIESIDEIELGKHGIYIQKDGKSGTFLPQVATETGWNKEEFLGHCSESKANLGWDGWKDADIFTYEAIVFNENELLKEASYYEKLDSNKVKCNLCPHYCKISDGKIGNCMARKNIDGKLYSMGYNNPGIIGAIDPIEKKPLRHFQPGKMIYSLSCNGCNFHCDNCQNDGVSQIKKEKHQNIKPIDIINDCTNRGLDMIAFTYTEPTIYYEYMLDIAKLAKENGIKTVMVSNGYINPEPLKELIPYIDAANIDLKSFDPIIHKKVTKGELEPVLNTIKTLFDSGVHIEITNLIIEDLTDNVDTIDSMYQWIVDNGMKNIPIHLIRFFPTFKMSDRKGTSIEIVDKIKRIALSKGIENIYG